MNRYFLYLILLNMLTNIVAYVPHILLQQRFNGGVSSMLLSVPIGMLFLYIFFTTMSRFPGKTYPDLVKGHFPAWVAVPYILFSSFMWFFAGFLTLQAFVNLSERFIDPNINTLALTSMFLLVVCFGAFMKSDRILYVLEIIVLINTPFIAVIFFKSYVNDYLSWDAIVEVLSHYKGMPTWEGVSAGAYTFMGLTNIAIFNRLLEGRITWRYWLLITAVGLLNIFTSMLIPVGLNGADGVGDYIYPWAMTADTLRMEYGFIERALFVFLLLYLSMSLVHISVLWHVSLELGKTVLPLKKLKWRGHSLVPVLFILFFCLSSFSGALWLNEGLTYRLGEIWLKMLLPANLFAAGILIWIVWREKKWRHTEASS